MLRLSRHALPLFLALSSASCGRNESPAPTATPAASATAPPAVSASAPPPPPRPSVSPPSSASPSASAGPALPPKEQVEKNLAAYRDKLKADKCSPNQVVHLAKEDAVFLTFKCAYEVTRGNPYTSTDGIAFVGTSPGNVVDLIAAQITVLPARGGFLHSFADGSVRGMAVVEMTENNNIGTRYPQSVVFQLDRGMWSQVLASDPARPGEGLPFSATDATPVFPTDELVAKIELCRSAPCSKNQEHENAHVFELYETWDGKAYRHDLPKLKPFYQAKLDAARAFAADYTAARTAASPSASAAPSASASASPGKTNAPNPRVKSDVGDCPFSLVQVAFDLYVLGQTMGASEADADAAASGVLAGFPAAKCADAVYAVKDYDWPSWKKRIGSWKPTPWKE